MPVRNSGHECNGLHYRVGILNQNGVNHKSRNLKNWYKIDRFKFLTVLLHIDLLMVFKDYI